MATRDKGLRHRCWWQAMLLFAAANIVAVTPVTAQQADATRAIQELTAVLGRLSGPDLPPLPAASAFRRGERTIAAGERVTGTVAASYGTLHIFGTVDGNAVTFNGDIIVHARGDVTGDAIAIGGRVVSQGGIVAGQTLTLIGELHASPPPAAPYLNRAMGQLALVGGWFAVLLIISIGVLVLASRNLAAVAETLDHHYGAALLAGVAGQIAFAPLLAALLIALLLTVLGILLIPFAAVVYFIVCAGLVMLGFLASAVVIGRGWRPASSGTGRASRAATLKALIVGLVVLHVPWLAAALLVHWPTAEALARGVAFAGSWVACTAGLGAALLSRAGIRQVPRGQATEAKASPGWQTPTPVSGVVAAKRPAPPATEARP